MFFFFFFLVLSIFHYCNGTKVPSSCWQERPSLPSPSSTSTSSGSIFKGSNFPAIFQCGAFAPAPWMMGGGGGHAGGQTGPAVRMRAASVRSSGQAAGPEYLIGSQWHVSASRLHKTRAERGSQWVGELVLCIYIQTLGPSLLLWVACNCVGCEKIGDKCACYAVEHKSSNPFSFTNAPLTACERLSLFHE